MALCPSCARCGRSLGVSSATTWLLLVAGCRTSTEPPDQHLAATSPLEVLVGQYSLETRHVTPVALGGPADLQLPPQGGRVLFIGALVRGARTPSVRLLVTLRDASGEVVNDDRRTVPLDAADADGWAATSAESFLHQANLEVCPDYDGRQVAGTKHQVDVEVTEIGPEPRTGRASLAIVPTCFPTDATCACLCASDYAVGKCSGP